MEWQVIVKMLIFLGWFFLCKDSGSGNDFRDLPSTTIVTLLDAILTLGKIRISSSPPSCIPIVVTASLCSCPLHDISPLCWSPAVLLWRFPPCRYFMCCLKNHPHGFLLPCLDSAVEPHCLQDWEQIPQHLSPPHKHQIHLIMPLSRGSSDYLSVKLGFLLFPENKLYFPISDFGQRVSSIRMPCPSVFLRWKPIHPFAIYLLHRNFYSSFFSALIQLWTTLFRKYWW